MQYIDLVLSEEVKGLKEKLELKGFEVKIADKFLIEEGKKHAHLFVEGEKEIFEYIISEEIELFYIFTLLLELGFEKTEDLLYTTIC